MGDLSKQNTIDRTWVIVDPVDLAEEAIELDKALEHKKTTDIVDSDLESDSISIIGSTADEECFHDSENSEETVPKESAENISQLGWTFVNSEIVRSESPPSESSSKQFYLNCLQEPVQELSEHELGSIQSDHESDSISVISECESLDENIQLLSDGRRISRDNKKLQIVSKSPPSVGVHNYFNGLMIGTILLASGSIFLGHYLNIDDSNERELPIYADVPSENDASDKYNVPTALSYCNNKHEADGINKQYGIDKCLKKIEKRLQRKKIFLEKSDDIQRIEKHLKIKEQYLSEKEKFLIEKEYELLKVEMKLKKQLLKGYRVPNNVIRMKQGTSLNPKGEKESPQKHHFLKGEFLMRNKKDHKKNEKYRKSYDENEAKPEFSKIKDSQYIMKSTERIGDEWDQDESNFWINTPRKEKNTRQKIRRDKQTLKKQSKNIYEKETKKIETGTNYVILDNGINETISGYWVGKLYKARSNLRNREHLGDWYFDRASYRKRKRDKAGWYFDWMMDREWLRNKNTDYM